MTRKVLATATALLLATGLIVASATAGPQGTRAQGDGPLRLTSRSSVPAAARAARHTGIKEARQVRDLEPEPARKGKLEAQLVSKMEETAAQTFDVVVTTAVDPAQLQLGSLRVTHTYRKALYGFAAKATREQITALEQMAEVESIGMDTPVHTMIDGASTWTGVAKAREDFGLTGDGDGFEQRYTTKDVVIAVIDTGM